MLDFKGLYLSNIPPISTSIILGERIITPQITLISAIKLGHIFSRIWVNIPPNKNWNYPLENIQEISNRTVPERTPKPEYLIALPTYLGVRW